DGEGRYAGALYVAEPSDYADERHRWMVEALRALHTRRVPIETSSLCMELEQLGRMKLVTHEYLLEITEHLPTLSLAPDAAERVRFLARARERRAEHLAVAALYQAGEVEQAMERERVLARRLTESASGAKRMSLADAALGVYQRLLRANDPATKSEPQTTRRRVALGIEGLQRVIRGLRPRSLTVIGARQQVGKSSIMVQMAIGQADAGERVGYVSIEDDEDIPGERALASVSDVPLRSISEEDVESFGRDDWTALTEGMDRLYRSGIQISIPRSARVADVCAEIRWLVLDQKCTVVHVDYLQKVRARGADVVERTANALTEIEQTGEELEVPIVLASQFNRPERGQEYAPPTIERLKNTGDIEASADVVLLAYYTRAPRAEDDGALVDPRLVHIAFAKVKWGVAGSVIRFRRKASGELVETNDEETTERKPRTTTTKKANGQQSLPAQDPRTPEAP
ncbi:hypothetical protein L6R52_43085, partial [Myxococcota bacterium]|nr:hypothetical protein [Myxococcota bacterium]